MKKLSYLWVILLLALTYQSCEDETVLQLEEENVADVADEPVTDNQYSRTYVNMDDIPDIVGSLEKKIGNRASKSGRALGNKITAKNYEVYLDSIAQMVNEGSDTNYSFILDVKSAAPNEFFNLVVGKTDEGTIKDPIVVKYILSQEDMDYFMSGGTDLKRMNATYSFYNFERFFDANEKMTASGNDGCGTGYIGGGGSGGPTIPPGGSVVISNSAGTLTTTFEYGNTSTVPYNYTITLTDPSGNATISSGQATSLDLSSQYTNSFGQGPVQVYTYPPQTAAIHQLHNTPHNQNGTISLGCSGGSFLDVGGWSISVGCDQTDQADNNKGYSTLRSSDCSIPEGDLATLTPFTQMILNNVSTHLGLDLTIPFDWSQYVWMSHNIAPETASINQFINDNGQSEEAKEIGDDALNDLMRGIEITDLMEEFGNKKFLNNLIESPSFQSTKAILEAATATSLNSKEKLYAGTITNNSPINFTFIGESSANEPEIIIQNPITSPITSLFHNHYLKASTGSLSDGRTLKTFSATDVMNFFILANANYMQDIDTFNMLLVTPDGELHAIMIANQSVFSSILSTMQQGNFQDNLDFYTDLLKSEYDVENAPINEFISSNLAAKRLHKVLHEYGLTVYEFDSLKNKWVRP